MSRKLIFPQMGYYCSLIDLYEWVSFMTLHPRLDLDPGIVLEQGKKAAKRDFRRRLKLFMRALKKQLRRTLGRHATFVIKREGNRHRKIYGIHFHIVIDRLLNCNEEFIMRGWIKKKVSGHTAYNCKIIGVKYPDTPYLENLEWTREYMRKPDRWYDVHGGKKLVNVINMPAQIGDKEADVGRFYTACIERSIGGLKNGRESQEHFAVTGDDLSESENESEAGIYKGSEINTGQTAVEQKPVGDITNSGSVDPDTVNRDIDDSSKPIKKRKGVPINKVVYQDKETVLSQLNYSDNQDKGNSFESFSDALDEEIEQLKQSGYVADTWWGDPNEC